MKTVNKLNNKLTALLAASAIAGIMSGGAAYAQNGTNVDEKQAGDSAPAKPSVEKHSCKGKNSCKGKGGCNSGDNGCKGKNSCGGKGGCSTIKKKGH